MVWDEKNKRGLVIAKNRIIYGFTAAALAVGLFFGIRYFTAPQKFYRADFMTKFNIRYLEQPQIKTLELLNCKITDDPFYINNEENCQTLSQIYGELID